MPPAPTHSPNPHSPQGSSAPRATARHALLQQLADARPYDLAVIGGGATGLGVALDAASRGLRVVLLESHDFAKGTSSRATKLLHGGVRYLAQGNISLVWEALRERSTLLRNAAHLAQPLAFVMPSYRWWESPFYGMGLKLYDALAGKSGLGPTRFLSRSQTLAALPSVQTRGLHGGVQYWDAQFDDARLALALARTAADQGALLVNYCPVTSLLHEAGKVVGLHCQDAETGQTYTVRAGCVINAAGVWVDALRQQDGQAQGQAVQPLVAPSQGVHVVVARDFLPTKQALLIPKTSDGRVLFAVPWLGKLILGTTDTPRGDLAREPQAFAEELEFILRESARYLQRAPQRSDILSIWVGLRPLVRSPSINPSQGSTQALSREHTIEVSASGLVTVTGGKWTTYRAMAEQVLQRCAQAQLIAPLRACSTPTLSLVGAPAAGAAPHAISDAPGAWLYGSEQQALQALPGAAHWLGGGLSEAMVRFAARFEYARTVEDVLARRSRCLFLDARLAAKMAPQVAGILAQETGVDPQLDAFKALAQRYLQLPA